MLKVFWEENRVKIFLKVFIPYCLYLAAMLFYTIHVICVDDLEEQGAYTKTGFICLILIGY
jgi:hypothetical protein